MPTAPKETLLAPVKLILPFAIKLDNVPTVVRLDVVIPDANAVPVKFAALAAILVLPAAVN